MANTLEHKHGGAASVRFFYDHGDGSFAQASAAEMRGWNTSALTWDRLLVDTATGALQVTGTLTTSDLQIGAVEIKDATSGDRASVSATGALKVDNSAVTQPVSGTVTANAGSGPFPVSDNAGSLTVDGVFWQATQPVSGPLPDAQLRASAVPVSGTVTASGPLTDAQLRAADVAITLAGETVALDSSSLAALETITANPATALGKTITYVPVNQGAAGTTVLAAASVGNKHEVVGAVLTMDAAGTLKFTGTGDLTGAMDVAANGGFVLPTSILPYFVGSTNVDLSLVTTGGGAAGVVAILTEA